MFNKISLAVLRILMLMLLAVFSVLAESVEYEFDTSSRSIMHTGHEQTLEMLVQQLYPNRKALWPRLQQEIKIRNPQAFNRYTGKIISGSRIQLVTIKTIRKSHVLNQPVVGSVESIQGVAKAIDTRGNERQLTDKAALYEGDRVTTEKAAKLGIKMIDDAKIFLKPSSSLRLTEYKMKSGFETGSKSILDLIKGGLRTITGAIGANPTSVYRFHTGVLTIGVRGTDYVMMLCEANNCKQSASRNDADSRLHVVVLDGLISLEDEEGKVGELIMGQYAVASREAKVKVDDAMPVGGLLNEQELDKYNEIKDKSGENDSGSIWPWLLGGALLGL